MNQEYKISLLKNGAQAADAKEVAVSLLGHLYNYINLKRFSGEIRFGKRDDNLSVQLDELAETRNTVLKTVESAMAQKKSVNLTLLIKMDIVD